MATMPQFDIPATMNKPGPWMVLRIDNTSDGDPSKRGLHPYRELSNDVYRVRIGGLWAEHLGTAVLGINYYLDRLPRGYQLMDFPKFGDESTRYKRLFGHPSGRFFDSQLRFLPHFLWLMDNMKGGCECVLCGKGKAAVPATKPQVPKPAKAQLKGPSTSKGPRPSGEMASRGIRTELGKRGRTVPDYYDKKLYVDKEERGAKPAPQHSPTDEEGTADKYKELVQILYRYRESKRLIQEDVSEKDSPDWRAEHNEKYGDSFSVLNSHLTYTRLQHSFVPRLGELVLWFRYHPDDVDLIYNPAVGGHQFYSPERREFHGFPRWQAGVVTDYPCSDPVIDFPDILGMVNRNDSLNRAGFRVETFPDPNNEHDKSASKQYKYVPLRQIRPINMWQKILRGIPEHKLDESILYALTCMTSVSLLEKYRFLGKWPQASIFCKGIYLGAELLLEGDAIKILPSGASSSVHTRECTDVLVITSIRLNLRDIEPEHIENKSPKICRQSSITFVGRAYTLDPSRGRQGNSFQPMPIGAEVIKRVFPTVGATEYGDWYPLHSPDQRYEVSFDQVLGRLYESGAVGMWTGSLGSNATRDHPPPLSYDLSSVLAGRRYASQTDERLPYCASGEVRWFWADTRVQALSLETVGGVEVDIYDTVRDQATMRAWRARLKIINGKHTPEDARDAMLVKQRGRKKGSRVMQGVVVGPDEASPDDDMEPPPHGSLSEAVRSNRGAGGMVVAGAAEEEDDDGSDDDTDSDSGDNQSVPSRATIVEGKKPARSVFNFDSLPMGPIKARKSAGAANLPSPLPTTPYAGRYDSIITPTMTLTQPGGKVDKLAAATDVSHAARPRQSDWKGKQQADAVFEDDDDTGQKFRSTSGTASFHAPLSGPDRQKQQVRKDAKHESKDQKPDRYIHDSDKKAIQIEQVESEHEDGDDEDGDDMFAPAQHFVEPEPKNDDDYNEEDDDEADDDEDDEEEEVEIAEEDFEVGNGNDRQENARMRTLADFQMNNNHKKKEDLPGTSIFRFGN